MFCAERFDFVNYKDVRLLEVIKANKSPVEPAEGDARYRWISPLDAQAKSLIPLK